MMPRVKITVLKIIFCLTVTLIFIGGGFSRESLALTPSKVGEGWRAIGGGGKLNDKSIFEVIDDEKLLHAEDVFSEIDIIPILKKTPVNESIHTENMEKTTKDKSVFSALKDDFSFIPFMKPRTIKNKIKKNKKIKKNVYYRGENGFIWPVDIRAEQHISSKFGIRIHPITKHRKKHDGIDIAAKTGVRVLAAADGCVIFAGRLSGYGKVVKIAHDNGTQTLYGHLSRISVKKGQRVFAGKKIGRVGHTGRATGSHLHFEIRAGKKMVAINPLRKLTVPHMVAQNSRIILSRAR